MRQILSGHSFTVFSFVPCLVLSLSLSLTPFYFFTSHLGLSVNNCDITSIVDLSVLALSLFSALSPGRYLAVSRTAVCSQIQNSYSFASVMVVVCVRLS